jgi:ATP-dependent RNA helicase DDX19/DBP5
VELYNLLTIGQSIIFVAVCCVSSAFLSCHRADASFAQRRDTADRIANRMTAEGHKTVSLHSGIGEENRDTVMDSFREGKTKVLITTNVMARGIDVLQVNMVVNYDVPLTQDGKPDPETYLHRIGAFVDPICALARQSVESP